MSSLCSPTTVLSIFSPKARNWHQKLFLIVYRQVKDMEYLEAVSPPRRRPVCPSPLMADKLTLPVERLASVLAHPMHLDLPMSGDERALFRQRHWPDVDSRV